MHLAMLESPDELLDIAFRRARKKAAALPLGNHAKRHQKDRELIAVTISAEYISQRLWRVVKAFPNVQELPPFYAELYPTIIDVNKTKQALSHLTTAARMIEKLGKGALHAMRTTPWDDLPKIRKQKKAFFGRISALLKKRKQSIVQYNRAVQKLRELPAVDFKAHSVILAGFPNTGKSTLLRRLTGSPAPVAAYAFTTKQLNIGYFSFQYQKIQVIDTPGLLDKETGRRNPIEKKGIAALNHLAELVVFVVDASEQEASIKKQKKLFSAVKKDFKGKKVFVVFNKTDLVEQKKIEKMQKEWHETTFSEGKGITSGLKEEIGKALVSPGATAAKKKPGKVQ